MNEDIKTALDTLVGNIDGEFFEFTHEDACAFTEEKQDEIYEALRENILGVICDIVQRVVEEDEETGHDNEWSGDKDR